MLRSIIRISFLLFTLILASCTSFWQGAWSPEIREGVSSSLVDYLYPEGTVPPEQASEIPRLDLPLRVGIAFVPAKNRSAADVSEATKSELLNQVKTAFLDRDYIEHIEVIPDTYLRSSKGFEGMQQVARLYGVDVMALVSYDQVSVSQDTNASLMYWTIVGAYLIEGTENEVQTFVDTAVFDVQTRKLLFRAPGIDKHSAKSTAVESREKLRDEQTASFSLAMEDMTGSLASELDKFEERLKDEPQLAEVNWDQKSGGGGSFGVPILVLLLLVRLTSTGKRCLTGARNRCR
jgi:rhombotail lipoprotein